MARTSGRPAEAPGERHLPYGGRRADPAPRPTERAILDATERLLAEVPLTDLSVEEILQEAGVSRTTFYKAFRSKYLVVAGLLEAVQAELVDVMRPWFAGGREPSGSLRQALGDVADSWARHRQVLRAGTESWHADPEVGRPWAAMMDRFVADIAGHIDLERSAGAAPGGIDSTVVARTLVWSSERMLYLAGFGMCGPGLEREVVEPLVSMWLGMVYRSAPSA